MGRKIKIFQVDAFTGHLFGGNPAAVCLLKAWLPDEIMQQIASENNLAETAFLCPGDGLLEIRWFTPTVEVDLCGHATLAAAHVLFHHGDFGGDEILFLSPRSGALRVVKNRDLLTLDFPKDEIKSIDTPDLLREALEADPIETYQGRTDLMAILPDEASLKALKPNFDLVFQLGGRGLIVTALGDEVDFVSRFFAPQSGIDEDPVTGSAHTTLTPFWSDKLKKQTLTARQLSKRGGELTCTMAGDRVHISGQAVTYMGGELNIDISDDES